LHKSNKSTLENKERFLKAEVIILFKPLTRYNTHSQSVYNF